MLAGQQSWMTYLIAIGIVSAIVLVVCLLGKVFPSKGNTAAANALMRAEVFFNPSREKVIQAKEFEEKEDAESGDPEK